MATKNQQSLKTVNLAITYDVNVPDRKSKAGINVWDVECVDAEGYRYYVQVYAPARERPQRVTATKAVVK